MTAGEPAAPPVRWGVHARAVPDDRLEHNLRHGGIAVRYGAAVPAATVRRLAAWYRADQVAVVLAPKPELGARFELSSWSGRAGCRTFDAAAFSDFRETRRLEGPESPPLAELRPAEAVEALRATSRRIVFVVPVAVGVSVEVRDRKGRTVRHLGHFTVSASQRLLLSWDARNDAGRRLPAGSYVAVVTAKGELGSERFQARFDLRRWRDADDADRQPVRQQGDA
jgi:hypothetical protein